MSAIPAVVDRAPQPPQPLLLRLVSPLLQAGELRLQIRDRLADINARPCQKAGWPRPEIEAAARRETEAVMAFRELPRMRLAVVPVIRPRRNVAILSPPGSEPPRTL